MPSILNTSLQTRLAELGLARGTMVKKRQRDTHEDSSSTDSCMEEQNGASGAIKTCQHIKKSVDTGRLRRQLKTTGLVFECSQCQKLGLNSNDGEHDGDDYEYDNTLWLCLKCSTQLCGRAKNQHALQHYQTPHSDSHALTMNTRSFEIWCYTCDSEVSCNSRKNLLECVELVKRLAQKPPATTNPETNNSTAVPTTAGGQPTIKNIELKLKSTIQHIGAMVPLTGDDSSDLRAQVIPLPPAPPPCPMTNNTLTSVPGKAKRVDQAGAAANVVASNVTITEVDRLPRVRGLANLGNTCFFNSVLQCLAQTPFLLPVLKELAEPGEEFVLPGGSFNFQDKGVLELPMIQGTLSSWGGLTSTLANALEELQSGGGVFVPSKLFDKFCSKCPLFTGGDQHDAHELLRQLLESVRSEDLKRYQRVILQNLGYKDQDVNTVAEEMRQKCKIYGNQAADRILRPEQVFRGFLVSTLTCQDCYVSSSRHEYFLDISLPVAVEKPQPPQRRRSSPEHSPTANKSTSTDAEVAFPTSSFFLHPDQKEGPTKSQLKREKERELKTKRKTKRGSKQNGNASAGGAENGRTDAAAGSPTEAQRPGEWGDGPRDDTMSSSLTNSEHSDADVEDNLVEDNATAAGGKSATNINATAPKYFTDSNGNPQQLNEKRDDTLEHMDKDSLEEDENDSGIATSPAPISFRSVNNNAANGEVAEAAFSETMTTSLVSAGLSEKGATLLRQISEQQISAAATSKSTLVNGDSGSLVAAQLEELTMSEQVSPRSKRVRTQSNSDWSSTIAPRYQCEDGECSVQSCLNNFTAVELMTGQNKVGCESCTMRINGPDPKAKSVNTNATKQLLLSSPPAVLILHLKRFQLGPRCVFRKVSRAVTYPMLLDIASLCGSKVKNLPNIDSKQKKILYALYGVVEHSGGINGGHYTCFVKVRPQLTPDDKRWKFLPHGNKAEIDQDDEQLKKLEELLAKEKARELRMNAMEDSDDFTNSSSNSSLVDEPPATASSENEAAHVRPPPGKWYYVSDSRVQEVAEEAALKAQAYLLFYERIY